MKRHNIGVTKNKVNGTKSYKSLSNCTDNSKNVTCDIYFGEVSRARLDKTTFGVHNIFNKR